MGLENLDSKRKKRLQKEHAVEFKDSVTPEELVPYLTCLPNSVKERIIRKQNNDGASLAAFQLTMDLPRYDDWFELLIPALRDRGLNRLADHLDDPQVDPLVERHGVQQNGPRPDPNFNPGSNGQPEHQGANFSPHRLRASGHQAAQSEERATVETGLSAASSEVPKRQHLRKGCITGDTMYHQLSATALEVLRLLDVPNNVSGKDWKGLAGLLGYSIGEVEQFKLEKSPTEALLKEWGIRENATLNTLMEALEAMEREDVHSQLQKVLGFHVEGSGQIPRPKSPPSCSVTPQPLPSVSNLPKLDLASGHNDEAKVVIRKPLGKRNDEPRDSSSEANRTGKSVANGDKQTVADGGKSKLETRNQTDVLDQDVEPENKNNTSKGGSIMNNLNRNPHAMRQNITSDQGDSAPKPKPQNNQLFVEDNLRESDQQSSNETMRKGTKMVAGDAGEGDTNTASVNNNLERQGQAANQSSSDSGDENCSGKMLQSQFSLASTTSSSNNDMSTMYSVTGPDDVMGSLKNPDEFDKLINLEFSNSSYPSILSDANDSKSLEKMADSQSMTMNTPGSKSKQNATSKDKPSSSATPSPSATPDLTASSTHPVVATPNTKGLESRQKSMKGTPVTQPGYVPEDVPGGLKTPSVDATFSKDSLMIAVTPGRMLHQPQTASTEEAAEKLQEPSLEVKKAVSETEHSPNNTEHNPPSHNIGTNSPITSPQTASTEEAAGKLQEPSFDAKRATSEIEHSLNNLEHNPPSHNAGTNSHITSPQTPSTFKTPSVDATFSKDSLMIAVTPGRMLRQTQTASTEEAAEKLQEPSLDAKKAVSETEHSPNNTEHNPPSHNIGTNSPITSPQSQNQSLSEDNPSPECRESSAPVTPEIEEPQRGSVLGSILHAGPALLSFMSALQSGDIAPFKN